MGFFFCVIFLFNLKKIPCGRARKTKNQVGLALLPHHECFSINRVIIVEINDLLNFKCSVNNFHFIDQSNGWTLNHGTLDFSLSYTDGLHLVGKGNLELGQVNPFVSVMLV